MSTNNLVQALPDVYRKNTGSNNYKLLALHGEAVDVLRADISAVLAAQDVHQATGVTLDRYGAIVDEPRGNSDDVDYRVKIQQKMGLYRGNGSWSSVSSGISNLTHLPLQAFALADNAMPHTAKLTVKDAADLARIPKSRLLLAKIASLLPAGVEICVTSNFRSIAMVGISIISKIGINLTLLPWQVYHYESISTMRTAAAIKSCLSVTVLERS